MQKFKISEKEQGFLFSQHYTCDYLRSDDDVFLFDKLIDSLDLSSIYESYSPEGGSTYLPRDMLGVILYAFFKGITSSRKIEELVTHDIRFIHLSGNHKMSYKSILNFKAKHRAAMEALFVSSVENALSCGLVQYDQVFALDGTKLNAYANIQKTKTKEEWKATKEQIISAVKEYMETSEKVDFEEDKTFGESDEKKNDVYQTVLSNLKDLTNKKVSDKSDITHSEQESKPEKKDQDSLQNPEEKKSKRVIRPKKVNSLKEAKDALEQCSQIDALLKNHGSEKPDTKINMTDPDSKMMKSDDNIRQRYNAQVISNQQFIVAANLTNEENDQHQLETMVEQLQENVPQKVSPQNENMDQNEEDSPLEIPSENESDDQSKIVDTDDSSIKLLADAGYNSGSNLGYLDQQENIDAHVSMHRRDQSDIDEDEKRFLKENFSYDEAQDEWICPAGNRLENYGEQINHGVKETIYSSKLNTCMGCSLYSKCVKTKQDLKLGYRTIRDNGTLIYRKEMKDKMSNDKAKQIYRKRSGEVEPIFGQWKYNTRIRGFYYRGLEKYKSEFFTLCLAHNLGKIMRYQASMTKKAA